MDPSDSAHEILQGVFDCGLCAPRTPWEARLDLLNPRRISSPQGTASRDQQRADRGINGPHRHLGKVSDPYSELADNGA